MSAPVIGIDLGTTYTCAAIYEHSKGTTIIPDPDGERIIPSVVYFDPKTGNVLVGKHALDEIPECQKNGLYDAKRIIGRQFEDEYIARYIEAKEVPFSIVRAEDGRAAFEVSIGGKTVLKTPEEVSAEVLKYVKNAATVFLGSEVTEAVISVPARFSNAQRKATKRAAELAGLTVIKLISEPTAAAIHYVFDKAKVNANILVFDFGGGTLDISVIKTVQKKFEVKVVYGDTFLGGRDIDKILFDHFYKKYLENRFVNDPQKRTFLRRLRFTCDELKRKLVTQSEAHKSIQSPFGIDEEPLLLSITKKEFEDLCSDIFDQALNLLKYCLDDSNISKSEISEVVLVGGTTRILKIREMLGAYFGDENIKTDIHPDEAIAAGASRQALLLKERQSDLEIFNVTEVTPLSLGINLWGKRMQTIIPKNSPLPFNASRTIITTLGDQAKMDMVIFEGERKNIRYNNLLTDFTLEGLPQERAGDMQVEIQFKLDEDGILNVTAFEKSTSIEKPINVTVGHYRLSDRKIRLSTTEAKERKYEDDIFDDFTNRYCKLHIICQNLLHDIEKVPAKSDQELIKTSCQEFLKSAEVPDHTEIEILDAKFAILMTTISDILKTNNLLHLIEL